MDKKSIIENCIIYLMVAVVSISGFVFCHNGIGLWSFFLLGFVNYERPPS